MLNSNVQKTFPKNKNYSWTFKYPEIKVWIVNMYIARDTYYYYLQKDMIYYQ
jgi:hypothetical protein